MKTIKKIKIGLVGVMAIPFRGDKEVQFSQSAEGLQELAVKLGFDLHIIRKGIYQLADAKLAAAELKEWGADFILIQTSSNSHGSFVYPIAQLNAFLGIWAVPEGAPTSEGGLPLNSFTSANHYASILKNYLTGYQKPLKWFFGRPGQPLLDDRLRVTVQALTALINFREKRIGLIGGVASGFDNLIVDERNLYNRLGVHVVPIDFDEMKELTKHVSAEEQAQSSGRIRASASQLAPGQENALALSGRFLSVYQHLAEERNLEAIAVDCWPRFQEEMHFAVCTVLGQSNSEGLVASCEGDVASAVGMLALRYMTSGDIVTLMDLVTIDPQDNSLLLWHCGPTSPKLADEKGVRVEPLWLFDGYGGEPIGLHNDLTLRPGLGTVLGFTPDFEHLLVMDGIIDNNKPSYRGSRGWLTKLRLNTVPASVLDVAETLINSGFQHHYPFAYGELAPAGLELAAWLGIHSIPLQKYSLFLKEGNKEC